MDLVGDYVLNYVVSCYLFLKNILRNKDEYLPEAHGLFVMQLHMWWEQTTIYLFCYIVTISYFDAAYETFHLKA